MTTNKLSGWKFPKAFWVANLVELLERAAYYGFFIAVTLYLTDVVGYTDIQSGWIAGVFAAGLYFLPTFSGALADKIGFRSAIILAFSLLTIGYFSLGALPYKSTVIPALMIIMVGGSFIKSVISGTVAKESNADNRARAYSIFYWMVNIGAFSGKMFAYPIRMELGVLYIQYYSAALSLLALIGVFLFYKSSNTAGQGKTLKETWNAFLKVCSNARLIWLIIIVTGFWMIQHQLYASMPKFVIRMVGPEASPEWIANVNPFVVVITVLFVTELGKRITALTSISIGMFLIPMSAFLMSMGPWLMNITGNEITVLGLIMSPITVMMILGIVFQALGESFISPRFLEYFSLQSPKGEEGLYLGFSHLHSFLANLLGFISSGYLLEKYCPKLPETVTQAERAAAYSQAHYIWYYYAVVGVVAAVALVVYARITKKIDAKG